MKTGTPGKRRFIFLFSKDKFVVAFAMIYMLITHHEKYLIYNIGHIMIHISNTKSLNARKWRGSCPRLSAVPTGPSAPLQLNGNPKGTHPCPTEERHPADWFRFLSRELHITSGPDLQNLQR